MNSSGSGGFFTKFKTGIQKANDQMFGDSFADHVVAGYKFLMVRYSFKSLTEHFLNLHTAILRARRQDLRVWL